MTYSVSNNLSNQPAPFFNWCQPPQQSSKVDRLSTAALKQKAISYPPRSLPNVKWVKTAPPTKNKTIKELFAQQGFVKKGTLGEGHYSTVWECYDPKKKRSFAFKKIRSQCFKTSDPKKAKFFQVDVHNGRVSRGEGLGFFPNHPNVLKVWGMVLWNFKTDCYRQTDNVLSMIAINKNERIAGVFTEFMPHAVDAFTFITKIKPIRPKDVKDILYQVASGIQAIHKLNCIHRDIKLENVLVNLKTNETKIIDFGFMYNLENCQYARAMTRCGSTPYTAPENLLGLGQTAKGDLWAFGVLAHAMCLGCYPFFYCENNMKKTAQNVINFADSNQSIKEMSYKRLPKKNVFVKNEAFWELLSSLLCAEKKRASIDDVLKSPFWTSNLSSGGIDTPSPLKERSV